MFSTMVSASLDILRAPSVARFEEHERDDLGSATVYVVVASIVTSVIGVIGFYVKKPLMEAQLAEAERQLEDLSADLGATGFDPSVLQNAMTAPSLTGAILLGLLGTLLGYFVYLGLIYLIGNGFGGTGAFGELAYDVSLFWAPLMVLRALIDLIAIGPIACLTWIVSLAVFAYNIYLAYLAIQSGMNLDSNGAVKTMLTVVLISIVLSCGLAFTLGAFFVSVIGAAGA